MFANLALADFDLAILALENEALANVALTNLALANLALANFALSNLALANFAFAEKCQELRLGELARGGGGTKGKPGPENQGGPTYGPCTSR